MSSTNWTPKTGDRVILYRGVDKKTLRKSQRKTGYVESTVMRGAALLVKIIPRETPRDIIGWFYDYQLEPNLESEE